jgi:hypothetical protein
VTPATTTGKKTKKTKRSRHMSTRVTLTVQSIRDPDKWFRVATVRPDEAVEALSRIAIIVDHGDTTDTLTVAEFTDWVYGDNTHEQEEESVIIHPDTGLRVIPDPPDMSCTGCDELASVEWYDFPEGRVHICGNCGSIAGFVGEEPRSAGSPWPPPRAQAPTRRERPASRVETPQPNRTFEGTWANLDREADRPVWGARVVVQDGEEVPEGATVIVRNRNNTKRARKVAGATVARIRDRQSGEFIRLVQVR